MKVAPWGWGVGVGRGEVKLGKFVVAAWPVPEIALGPGIRVDSKDKTSSNEIFWVSDVS